MYSSFDRSGSRITQADGRFVAETVRRSRLSLGERRVEETKEQTTNRKRYYTGAGTVLANCACDNALERAWPSRVRVFSFSFFVFFFFKKPKQL